METQKNKPMVGSIMTGLLLIAIGIGFLLQSVGAFDFSSIIRDWWPLGIIALGGIQLISSPRNWVWPLIMIGVGIWLQFAVLGKATFNLWEIIAPVAFILIGLNLIFSRKGGVPKGDSRNRIETINIFSGSDLKSTSDAFEGGSATAIFGGFKIDLRETKINTAGAQLATTTIFGGGEIIVPKGWQVRFSGVPVFGGYEDKTESSTDPNAPILQINGTVVFGGVEIKN